jgi:hypothetical protein
MGEASESEAAREFREARQQALKQLGVLGARLLQAVLLVSIPIIVALRVANAIPFWPIGVACVALVVLMFVVLERSEDRFNAAAQKEASKNLAKFWVRPFEAPPSVILSDTLWGFVLPALGVFLVYLMFSWTASGLPYALQVPALIMFTLGIVGTSVLLARRENRAAVVDLWGLQWGRFGATMIFVFMVSLFLFFFACLTTILQERGLVELIPTAKVSFDSVTAFFAWQGLDLVPLLDANETLRWFPPLTYVSTGTGILVFLFKLSVLVSVVGLAKALWSAGSSREEA